MEAKKSFGDAIVSQELNKEAWKKLSREFKWNEELIRKYRDQIDWEALSCNYEMLWTASILENFKNYSDWSRYRSGADALFILARALDSIIICNFT